MKKLFLLLASILLASNVFAQSASDFLNTIIEKTKSYKDISIIFNYRIINAEAGINESMSGYGSMRGEAYLINISGQELISNGEILWTYLIDDEEVMISEVTEDNNNSPISIIKSLTDNTNVSFIKNETDIKTIEVKANYEDAFDKIQISVDKDLKIENVHIFSMDGNEFIYEITDFKTNQDLPDEMFIFNEAIYPNVEVIDMR